MKRFRGFVIKEFLHIFRDFRTMLILFGMPVAQILLFGYVITNELKDIRIAILDKSKDHITYELTNKIISSEFFILDRNLSNTNEIEEIFKEGNVKEVIIFEHDFAKKLGLGGKASVQLIGDASDANTANLVINYTSGILRNYLIDQSKSLGITKQIVPEFRMEYNKELKGVYMFVPGIMALILMLVCALMTSISIAREKELGTMETLLVSPLKPLQIILGKVTPYILLSFINAITIIVLSYLVFKVPVQGSVVFLFAECTLYILLALSVGIFISTIAKTQQNAMFISMVSLMLPTILLSGFIFPIENMPNILQWLSYLMPPRWFITIVRSIMLKGTGFLYVWKETLILVVMVFIFLWLSIKNFKVRLE
jgi:ABC-2 type transport system permease protein